MEVTYSETVDDYSMSDLSEYANEYMVRMAIAKKHDGCLIHVCHELTTCRDNLQYMLCAKLQNKRLDCGGCCTLVEDTYKLEESFGIMLYCKQSRDRLERAIDNINKLCKYKNVKEFSLTELPSNDRYGYRPLWFIEGSSYWNSPLRFSMISLFIRLGIELGTVNLLNIPSTFYGGRTQSYMSRLVKGLGKCFVSRILDNPALVDAFEVFSKRYVGWGIHSFATDTPLLVPTGGDWVEERIKEFGK